MIGWGQDIATPQGQHLDAPSDLRFDLRQRARHRLPDVYAPHKRQAIPELRLDGIHIIGGQRLKRVDQIDTQVGKPPQELHDRSVTVEGDEEVIPKLLDRPHDPLQRGIHHLVEDLRRKEQIVRSTIIVAWNLDDVYVPSSDVQANLRQAHDHVGDLVHQELGQLGIQQQVHQELLAPPHHRSLLKRAVGVDGTRHYRVGPVFLEHPQAFA